MSMLNLDGQLVATALLHQQGGEVARELMDTLNASKVQQAWEQQAFVLQQNHNRVVAKYNDLADRYNGVLADNKKVDAAHLEQIADKDRKIAGLENENAELRHSLMLAEKCAETFWSELYGKP